LNYFVVWPDGQKFGPADIGTLAQWNKEGRIDGSTELEEVDTGRRLKLSDLDLMAVSWEEAAPVPKEPDAAEHEMMQAVASDRPVGDTNFEIPQEYPLSSGSPYPVESYYTKGKSDLSTAWALATSGLVGTFVLPCCCSFFGVPISMVLTGLGIYYADRALKSGDLTAKSAKTYAIVIIIVQGLLLVLGVLFYGFMIFGSFGGMKRGMFRP